MTNPIIIDCDPGHDDAIAIILACSSPELDIKAITTSAGNQTPDKTLRNALKILTLLNRKDIPVAGGAVRPLVRELVIADNVHGESGIDGPELPEPAFEPVKENAVELMAKILRDSDEQVTLVPTGPLTNIGLLLATHRDLACKIKQIVLMGGSASHGNWSPTAEFNIYVDPEAADIVFKSNIPIIMCGLDVTHQAQVFDDDIERIRAIGNPISDVVAELLDFFMIYHRDPKWGFEGAPLHDPCTIAWLLNPSMFTHERCWVGIETGGTYTQGMTVVDKYHLTNYPVNTKVLFDVNRKDFIELLITRLKYYN